MDDVALPSTSRSARPAAGALLLAALAPVSMLAVVPSGWYPFGPVKWLAVSVLVAAGSALVLRSGEVRLPRSLVVAVALLLGALAVGAVVGVDPLYAWIGTPERRFGFLTWCLCAAALAAGSALVSPHASGRPLLRCPEAVLGTAPAPSLMVGLVLAGLGVGAVATAEALGWEPEVLQAGGRLTATFGSAAYLGAAAALLLPACLGAALDRRVGARARRAAALAVPLLAVALLGSGARAAWVGVVTAAVAVVVARRAWRAVTRVVIVGGAVALVAVAAALLVLTPVGDRIGSLADADAPGGRGRIDEWRIAARVVADHPVTGVGAEGYRIAFSTAVDAHYERTHGREQHPDRAHSAPLDVALAGGLPALGAWLAVAMLVGRSVLRAVASGSALVVGVAAALVAHWTGQLLLFPLVELEPLAWLLAGTVVASAPARPRAAPLAPGFPAVPAPGPPPAPASKTSAELAPERSQERRPWGASSRILRTGARKDAETAPLGRQFAGAGAGSPVGAGSPAGAGAGRRSARVGRVTSWVLAALAAVAAVSGVTEVIADHRAGVAAGALQRGDTGAAAGAATAAAALRPDVVRLHLLAARALVADQQGTLAGLAEVEAALDISPGDPVARLERARLLVERAVATAVPAHAADAAAVLDEELERDPSAAALWRLRARLAELRNDDAAARAATARADDLTPPDRDDR